MKFIEVETYAELSKLGADIIADVIKNKSNLSPMQVTN